MDNIIIGAILFFTYFYFTALLGFCLGWYSHRRKIHKELSSASFIYYLDGKCRELTLQEAQDAIYNLNKLVLEKKGKD